MRPERSKSLGARRITPQQAQERVSRGQLSERLAALGWIASPLDDVGEDFHVQIFDGGRSTGLAFDVQLKSTSELGKHRGKGAAEVLRYPLAVKDLLHWEVSTTLVVVILFDVEERTGYWQPVPVIIEELDKGGRGWRKRISATVSIPLANTLDDGGARRLRWAAADHYQPIIKKPKKLRVSLNLSLDSDAGKNALAAFNHALDTGQAVTLEGAGLPRVVMPEYHRRIYGDERGTLVSIRIGPTVPKSTLAVRVEVESTEGFAAIPHVELRAIKHGRKQLCLSNEHQGMPLVFGIELLEGEGSKFYIDEANLGRSVHEAKEAAAFLLAASGEPATIRLIAVDDGRYLFTQSSVLLKGKAHEYRRRHDVLEKLRVLQTKIAALGAFSLLEGLTSSDVRWIDVLYRACQGERVESNVNLTFNVQPDADELPITASDQDIRLVKTGVRLKLLGVEIPLGKVEARVLEPERFLAEAHRARSKAKASGKPAPVSLPKLRVLEAYCDWPFDSWESLARIAEASGGYFTRSDAHAAKYNDVGLEALVAQGRVEPCSSEVFRVVPYPPSEHEDLIFLWLQSDRKAVFSHETALALHGLSDILPTRRHILVPDDWDAHSRRLPIDVDIYRAAVPEVDITWRGGVPVTKPLRTVKDCIAADVPDEIVDQAISEGIERGMFEAADVARVPRAESA